MINATAVYFGKLREIREPQSGQFWDESAFPKVCLLSFLIIQCIDFESSHSFDIQSLLYENNRVFKGKALESLSLDIAKGLDFLMKTDQVIKQLLQDFVRANVISTVCFHMAFLKAGFLYPQLIGGHMLMCATVCRGISPFKKLTVMQLIDLNIYCIIYYFMNIITFMPRQIKSHPNLPPVLVSGTIIKPYPESFLLACCQLAENDNPHFEDNSQMPWDVNKWFCD